MDGTSKYLLGLSITLVLVVLLLAVGYLWLRARKELGHLRQLFDELPDPALRVDLVSFKPLLCNRAFSRLFGYANNLECVSQFTRHPHLPQQNFYQIYRLSQESGTNEAGQVQANILLQDRLGNRIDHQQLIVRLDASNRYMDIVLGQSGSNGLKQQPDNDMDTRQYNESSGGDILLQQNLLAYFKLDLKLNIIACNQASRELFQLQHFQFQKGSPALIAFEKIFPSEYADRLVNIYRLRLAKHGRLALRHAARIGTTNKKGRWNITRDPLEEHYHAFFCLDETNSFLDSQVSDLLDEGHGFWELNHRTGLLVHSQNWLNYLGYGAVENVDELSFWFSIISPNDREEATRTIQAAKPGEPFKIQYKIASGRGVEIDIETRGLVAERDADGSPVLTRGIHIDVSRSNMNGLDREAHHQLMNQIASILGYADMIRANEIVPIEVKGFAQEVVTNSEKIRDLLAPAIQNKPDPGALIEKIALRHKLDVAGNTFLLSTIAEGDLEEMIRLVLQFMMNEGSSESNCKLTISNPADAWCSACTQEISSSYVCLTVEHDELHIERKHFLHLLEPGFMTSSVGQENSLLRASELAHAQGGHFSLTLKDPGFAVALYLPELLQKHLGKPYVPVLKVPGQETGSGPADPANEKTATAGRNILIIDDEVSVANYLKKIVERAGYEATVFTDSSAALDHFKHHAYQFDLVITDQTMPGPSGDVVMQLMLEQNPLLPIIVCTGYSQAISSTAAYKAGAAAFVTKPVQASHLLQTINRTLGSVQ